VLEELPDGMGSSTLPTVLARQALQGSAERDMSMLCRENVDELLADHFVVHRTFRALMASTTVAA
jgi:hypothetical protein